MNISHDFCIFCWHDFACLLNEINTFCFLTMQLLVWYWLVLSYSLYPFLLWTCWNENQVSFLHPLCDNWLKAKREQSNWPLFRKSAFMEAWVIYSHRLTVSTIISPPSFLRPRTCGRQKHQSLPIQVSDTLLIHFICKHKYIICSTLW